MPIRTHVNFGTFDAFFDEFESHYPTVEDRYAAALQLADASQPLPEQGHISRNFIAGHWGDDGQELRHAADFVYNLAAAANQYHEHPALIFRKGSPQDILSEEDYLEDDVVADYGKIAVSRPILGFDGEPTDKGVKRNGVAPPYLVFGASIAFTDAWRINVDMLTRASVVEKMKSMQQTAAYIGAVSLKPDVAHYRETKRIQEREVVVGEALCARILKKLVEKSIVGAGPRIPILGG